MSSQRPRIGITAWRRPLPTPLGAQTDLYTLGAEYAAAVQDAGGLPLILPHGDDPEATLDAIDGLLLSGGGDVDPRSYGAEDDAAKEASVAADRWEIALLRGARRRDLPVLGICRGMQIMAVAHGGQLAQDIAGADGHPDMTALSPEDILAMRHAVRLAPESRLASVYGTASRLVNTIHHQAVTDPGTLAAVATGVDGMIEAVEAPDRACMVGVQWHPEKLPAAERDAERALFEHLVVEARAYRNRTRTQGA